VARCLEIHAFKVMNQLEGTPLAEPGEAALIALTRGEEKIRCSRQP
jgi:hypothetical protein